MKKTFTRVWFIAVILIVSTNVSAQRPRDLVLINGKVYTVDEKNSVAEAISIVDGRIANVGTTQQVLGSIGAGSRVVDLKGRTVVPGLIDAHGHLINLGLSLLRLNLVGTKTYQQVVTLVAVEAESSKSGAWITGRGWDQNDWPEKAFPHFSALNRVSPNNPVALTRIDGHALLVNAEAMRIAGLSAATEDPPGGKIIRDDAGNPTGVLVDRAMGLVSRHIPPTGDAEREKALRLAIEECLKYGLTGVHDAGVSADDLELYTRSIDKGEFDLRVYAMIQAANVPSMNYYMARPPLIGYGKDRLTVRSVKAMMDGALGSRGAALLAPYTDDPGNTGLLILNRKRLATLTTRALNAGYQVATHAIGDRGNRTVLNAYEDALAEVPKKVARNARLRVEHAQIVHLEDIPRFAELGVIPSMQATHATSDMYWAEDRLGPERIRGAYAWRKFLKQGSRIANGSDFPVEQVNPLLGFYASITRQDAKGWPEGGWRPNQVMTRQEALRSFTIDAAYAAFEEDVKGSIEPGKLADLVVLSKDIMQIAPKQILNTEVIMTLLGGEVVYRR